MSRPNIVLFMSDNQPADLLGCYGNDEIKTPHLDALASRGVQFDHAYCVNAMCSPCRASVLTGLMPSQHGIHNWLDDKLIDKWPDNWSAIGEFANIPSIIKRAGYATALIGKFHLGVPFIPQLAFDHWVTFPHGHTTSFYGNDIIDQEERYRFAGHTVDFFTDKTIEFLEHQSSRDEPFFAFVPYNGPYGHWPAIKGRADNQFAEIYDDTDMHSIPREGLDNGVLERFGLRIQEGGLREQFKGPLLLPNNIDSLRNYFSQVSLIDHGVGRIVAALDRLDLSRDTLVTYTSDHGFSLGHNGVWGHGAASFPASAHRPSYHIPLLMAGGPVEDRANVEELVSQIDLFPTLAKIAGSDETPSLQSDARDLTTIFEAKPQPWRDAVFMEQEETRAIRTKDWVYAMRFQGSASYPLSDELYNLQRDPMEKNNLSTQPEYRKVVSDLQEKLTTHFERFAEPAYDLWKGGTAKSNVTFENLWKDAWGEDWQPKYS